LTRLSQWLAIEKGAKAHAERVLSLAHHDLQQTGPLSGLSRTYQPRDSEGEELPGEDHRVQFTVADKVDEVRGALTRVFDVVAAKETGNTHASADVVVDGEVLLRDVPVTVLLFLEKQLVHLRTFVAGLPVLDPAVRWHPDPNSGAYRSDEVRTTRTRKDPVNHRVAEATPQHPEQVQVFMIDKVIGDYAATKFSGAVPADLRRALVERADALLAAVKQAREEANTAEAADVRVGQPVLGYLFAPVVTDF
jgi:hypothetical protein